MEKYISIPYRSYSNVDNLMFGWGILLIFQSLIGLILTLNPCRIPMPRIMISIPYRSYSNYFALHVNIAIFQFQSLIGLILTRVLNCTLAKLPDFNPL